MPTHLKDIRHLWKIPCPWLKDVESNSYLNLCLPSGPRGCRRSGSGSSNQLLANHSAPNPKLYNTVLNNPWHTRCLPCTWIDVGGFSGNMLVFVVSHLPHAAFPQSHASGGNNQPVLQVWGAEVLQLKRYPCARFQKTRSQNKSVRNKVDQVIPWFSA